MSERVLVTGATGLLGREIVTTFKLAGHDVVGTSLTRADGESILQLDLLDETAMKRVLDEVKPSIVVNCAANRSPYSCTHNADPAKALNSTAPGTIASLTIPHNILLIHISTDYVFSGPSSRSRDEAYRPLDEASPLNAYGATKLGGERAILAAADAQKTGSKLRNPVLILRVPLLYGHVGSVAPEALMADKSASAVHGVVKAIWDSQDVGQKSGRKVQLDDYALRRPTATEDVARVVMDLAKLYGSADRALGQVLHFSASEGFTMYQMAEVIADILGLPMDGIEAIKPGERVEEDGIERPYNAYLGSEDLEALGVNVRCMRFKAWWQRELTAAK